MALISSASKSGRLLASRRYTHETLTDAQESFTNVLDLQASETYTQAGYLPSSGLPFSGSSQINLSHRVSGSNVLKYWHRHKLTKSNTNNEVWFFLNPTGSDSGIGAQLINDNQQVNFVSPKYSISTLATTTTADSTPGYLATLYKSSAVSNSIQTGSLDGDDIVSTNDYIFDYKTGVVEFKNSSLDPTNSEYLYMTVYQYTGTTSATGIDVRGNVTGSDIYSTGTLDIDGATTLNSTLDVDGATTLNGTVTLGNATGDTITATGRFNTDIVPSTDSARDLGTSTLQFAEAHIDTGYIDSLTTTTNVDIDDSGGDGAMDGVIIGAATAAAGTFTTLNTTGLTTIGDASGDTLTINAATINPANIAAGTDNTVVVYNGSTLLTDEIDSKVWDGNLVDTDGSGANNELATWSDSDSIIGEGNLTFDGSTLAVTGAVTVSGNLEVNGTTTYISSSQVDIGDRILTLNAQSVAGDGGLYVNDATGNETGSLLWDVSANRWIGGLKDSEVNILYAIGDSVVSSSAEGDAQGQMKFNGVNVDTNALGSGDSPTFGTITANTGIVPDANDGAYIGTTATGFSDLHLATGGVINWANGEITMTETADLLVIAGGNTRVDRLELDSAADYLDVSTDLQIIAAADITLNPGGNNVKPGGDSQDDLGVSGTAWRKLFVDDIELNSQGSITNAVSASIGYISGSGDMKIDGGATFGGGYGSTGTTISSAGVLQADGAITAGGNVTAVGSFVIGSADMSETDLEKLDGITNGAGLANKALVLDGSADIVSGINNLLVSRLEIDADTNYIDVSTDLQIIAAADIKLDPAGGEVDVDGNLIPNSDSADDLGASGQAWNKLWVDDIDLNGQGSISIGGTGRIDLNASDDSSIRASDDNTITFEANGTDIAQMTSTMAISGSTISTGSFGYLNVVGDAVIGGNLTFGDAATDNVSFSADVSSSLIPNNDDAFDLGSSGQQWKDLYVDGVAYIDTIGSDGDPTTSAYIAGGEIDATVIGSETAAAITGTTIDATTDFTIGGTVITDNTITDDGTLVIASTTATSFSDGNITNVGSIALDSIAADDGSSFTISNNWTNAGNTIANLGTVSAATSITATDLIGTNIDGILGADTARAITGTTIDATSDFTIDGLVLTADTITNDDGLSIIAGGSGDITLDPAGNNVLPGSDSADSLGQSGTQWAKLWVDDIDLAGQGSISMGGTAGRIDLDADDDTSIRSAADDVITFEAGAVDIAQMTSTMAISGSSVSTGSLGQLNIASSGSVYIPDSVRINFGDSNDLKIYHSGNHSIIQDTGTGNLRIKGSIINIQGTSTAEDIAKFTENAGAELYYDDSKKFETSNTGIAITGDMGATISGSSVSTGSFGRLQVIGNTDLTGDITVGGNLTLGDAASDSVSITADLTSHLIPNAGSTYDLGSSSQGWNDLHLSEGGVINWDNGDATLTQASDVVTLAGATLTGTLTNALSITANGGIGMTSYNASAAVSNLSLDIDGMTAIGADLATGDIFAVDDGAGGTNRKVTIDRIADFVSGSAFSKISGDVSITGAGVATVTGAETNAALTAGDGISAGGTFNGAAARTFAIDLSEYSDVQIASGDKFLVLDSNNSTEQLESVDDLAAFISASTFSVISGDVAITGAGVATVTGATTNAALTAGVGLSTTSGTFNGGSAVTFALDLSELSSVDVASGDRLATLDSNGSTEQLTLVDDLADYVSGSAFSKISGDITIAGTGVSTIGADTVANTMLENMAANTVKVRNAGDAGDPSDLALATTQILIGNGSGFTAAALSGDVTMTNAGVVSIGATKVTGAMLNDDVISGQGEMTGDVVDADELLVSDAGTVKRADFSVVRDAVFNDVSGDILIADGGGATIQANSVALTTDTTGNYMVDLAAGALIDVTHTPAEGSTGTIAVDLTEAGEAAIANGDYILFLDGGATGTHAKEAVHDLATLFSGTGLTATNSVIAVDASQTQITSVGTIGTGTWEGDTVVVGQGGTGATSFTDGHVLLGSGAGAITALDVTADGAFLVGDGSGDPVAETGNTARTSLGVGTGDSPTFTGLTATGNVAIQGDLIVTGDRVEARVGSLQVEDHTITVGSGSTTSALMNQAGLDLGVSGSVAFLRYDHGTTTLSSSVDLTADQLHSTIGQSTGLPPLTVSSNAEVANLNAAKLSAADWDAPLAIGGTTAAAGTFTTMTATTSVLGTLGGNVDHSNYNSTNVDINSGDISGVTISGGLTWSAAQDLNNQNLTNVDIDSGDISGVTISGGLTWSAAQDLGNQNLTNVDIDSGDIASGVTINKSPVITLGGDLSGNVTLSALASGTLTATIASNAVQTGMVHDDVATELAGDGLQASSGVMAVDVSDFAGTGLSDEGSENLGIDAAQTGITSIRSTSLQVGRDTDNQIDFGTDNMIKFEVDGQVDEFRMSSGGTFHADADIVAYSSTTASDINLKKNITDTKYGLADIMKLRGVDYDWKREDMGHDVGVLAQEVEAVIPEIVKEYDGLKGRPKFKAVDYNKLVPVLIESIKELKQEIDELKKNQN